MGILQSIFKPRDKPKNLGGNSFLWGGSTSGKVVNEQTAIGLDRLYYAKITENENGEETYDTPQQLAKAMTAELSVELAEATLYADDGAAEVVKEFQSGTLALGVDDIGVTAAQDLTGATIDDNKVLISTSEDGGDPVAIGFRAKKSNGKYRYFWLYKVKFGIVDALLGSIPQLIEAGVTLFISLIENLPTIIIEIVKAVPQIIAGLVQAFTQSIPKIVEVGANLVRGIQQLASWLWDKVSGWISSIWDGICDFFGIHSPSKEMGWVGEMLVEGLAGAIDANGKKAVCSAEHMAEDINGVMQGLAADMTSALPNKIDVNTSLEGVNANGAQTAKAFNVTIPLKVTVTNLQINNVKYGIYPIITCTGNYGNPTVAVGKDQGSNSVNSTKLSIYGTTINVGDETSTLYTVNI